MQEGVAIEVAEAVLQSLKGELSSNTVNAPMVPAETLVELQPYITLSQGLGKTAVQLVAEQGFAGVPPVLLVYPCGMVLSEIRKVDITNLEYSYYPGVASWCASPTATPTPLLSPPGRVEEGVARHAHPPGGVYDRPEHLSAACLYTPNVMGICLRPHDCCRRHRIQLTGQNNNAPGERETTPPHTEACTAALNPEP